MRRIINSTSVLICVQFALGATHLFAASNDLNSNSGNPGIFGAILGVVVPALLVIVIGGGIYVWLRRNKPSLTNLFPTATDIKKLGYITTDIYIIFAISDVSSWHRSPRQL